MEFNDINLILTVERIGKISEAADFLGVSQPALSKMIKQIERKLDVKLFMRLPRGVKLTKHGEIYIDSFKKILMIIKTVNKKISKLKSEYFEEIKISIHPILGNYLIPKLEEELISFSEINVNYIFQNSRDGIKKVLNGEVDCAIVADAKDYPDLVKKTLWKEYVTLYSRDGEIKDTVLYNSKMISANKVLKNLSHKRSRAIDDYSIICSLLKNNEFMALLPNRMIKKEDRIMSIKKFGPSINISLVYRSDRTKTKTFLKVASIIKGC